MEAMTQAEFARRHDVSRKTVTKWKQSGLIVMEGDCVDVQASDERLRRYRFAQDGRAQRGAKKQAARLGADAAGPVKLPVSEIRRRLQALDWTRPAAATPEQARERARLAAKCVALEAVESDVADDGHWGGFQLRDPKWWGRPEALPDQEVVDGFGFELTPLDVLRLCRFEAAMEGEDWDDEDATCEVDLRLLAALAYPHYQGQHPTAESGSGT